MSGTKPRRNRQSKVKQLADEKLSRSDLQSDLSKLGGHIGVLDWLTLSAKYGLPLSTFGYISNFARTGTKDSKHITSPVLLVCDVDRTIEPTESPSLFYEAHEAINTKFPNDKRSLYLQISDECTTSDIEIFLRENTKLIAEKMTVTRGHNSPALRQTQNAKRDDKIYNDLLNGKTANELSEELNITPEYVRQIFARQKKKRDI